MQANGNNISMEGNVGCVSPSCRVATNFGYDILEAESKVGRQREDVQSAMIWCLFLKAWSSVVKSTLRRQYGKETRESRGHSGKLNV
jgi:hypothetical protein